MKSQTRNIIVLSLALGTTLTLVWIAWGRTADRGQRLADGSWLKIRNAEIAEEVSYNFPDDPPVQPFFWRLVPGWLSSILPGSGRAQLLPRGSADLHMSGDGKSCLFIVTAREETASTKLDLKLAAISGDQGPGTSTSPAVVTVQARQKFQGWAWEDFPRHSRSLLVRCWGTGPGGQLVEAARFKIRNPGYEPEVQ